KERRFNRATNTYIDGIPPLNTTQGINDDPLIGPTPPLPGDFLSRVNNNFAVDPITGEIYRNAYWDESLRQILDACGLNPSQMGFQGQLLGTVKFDAVSGLALAAINTRIADISNAVEGVTKVLSVSSSNMDAVLSIIK